MHNKKKLISLGMSLALAADTPNNEHLLEEYLNNSKIYSGWSVVKHQKVK